MATAIFALIFTLSYLPLCPGHLTFAIYKNEIYTNSGPTVEKKNHDTLARGYQVLVGLMMMKNNYKNLPNMMATVDGTYRDVFHPNFELGFYNFAKKPNKRELWVEHDYYGWAEPMIAPFPIFWQEMKRTANFDNWILKEDNVFWTGNTDANIVRENFLKCTDRYPQQIAGDGKTFHHLSGKRPKMFGQYLKSIHMDLRKLIHHRYLIYIPGVEWSSSLKRMMSAGAIPIIPKDNPHVTIVTRLLEEKCSDCYLTYSLTEDVDDLCNELAEIVHPNFLRNIDPSANVSTVLNRQQEFYDKRNRMADKLIKFIDEELSLEKMLDYQLEVLQRLSDDQKKEDIKSFIDENKLQKLDCGTLMKWMKTNVYENGMVWQYDEWYNNDCSLNMDTNYLNFLAI